MWFGQDYPTSPAAISLLLDVISFEEQSLKNLVLPFISQALLEFFSIELQLQWMHIYKQEKLFQYEFELEYNSACESTLCPLHLKLTGASPKANRCLIESVPKKKNYVFL